MLYSLEHTTKKPVAIEIYFKYLLNRIQKVAEGTGSVETRLGPFI